MIAKEKCGCKVVWGFLYGVTIEYCLKHKAVDDLYEALKDAEPPINELAHVSAPFQKCLDKIHKALAKVEGNESSCREHWLNTILGEKI